MPLLPGKSEKTFRTNISTEMKSGKPKDQALAIAYSIKRKKKMADGGMVEQKDHPHVFGGHDPYTDLPANEPKKPFGAEGVGERISGIVHNIIAKKYAMGGMVDHDEPESMAEAPEYYDEDFLSDEEQDHDINMTYPDPDHKEDTEGMEPMDKKKMLMRRVMSRIMSK